MPRKTQTKECEKCKTHKKREMALLGEMAGLEKRIKWQAERIEAEIASRQSFEGEGYYSRRLTSASAVFFQDMLQ